MGLKALKISEDSSLSLESDGLSDDLEAAQGLNFASQRGLLPICRRNAWPSLSLALRIAAKT